MSLNGVSFQPGQQPQDAATQPGRALPASVQEAIRVLSLRIPRVVGTRAVSPQVLLTSPGSGGNPQIDSVVNQVMARYFPTEKAPTGAVPSVPTVGTPGPGESHTMPPSPPVPHVPSVPVSRAPSPPRYEPPRRVPPPPHVTVDAPWQPPPPPAAPNPPEELPLTGGYDVDNGPLDLKEIFRRKYQGRDYEPTPRGGFRAGPQGPIQNW